MDPVAKPLNRLGVEAVARVKSSLGYGTRLIRSLPGSRRKPKIKT